MIDDNDVHGRAALARLLDFFGDRTSWQRRLWTVGTVTRLRETYEAVELLDPVPAAQHSLEECKKSARDAVKLDPGIASDSERGRIAGLLSNAIASGGAAHQQLDEIATLSQVDYLVRWAAALRSGGSTAGAEAVARYVASHLLDSGSSPGHLFRWWTRYGLYNEQETHTLPDLLELAQERIVEREAEHEVLVLFKDLPDVARPGFWLSTDDAHLWLAAHGFSEQPQCVGGLLLHYDARDAGAAVQRAMESLDTYAARVTVASSKERWVVLPRVWVAGSGKAIPMARSRRVDIPVLRREEQIFASATDERVDAALQLVSLSDEGAPAAAVAGAWAGLESILKAPGDSGAHLVAPRLAQLVTCSFCRSELTDLAWHRVRSNKDGVSRAIRDMSTNLERAERMLELVVADADGLCEPSDAAGVARMKKIAEAPRQGLETVRQNADDALRRLYRQRNVVLHAGRTSAVALPSTLRVTAPLIGAGMDRIAHGWFVDGVRPLRLAAIAELQLGRLETPDATRVTRLLTPSGK